VIEEPRAPEDVSFFDEGVRACPYPAYDVLRELAPVWRDPVTGFYVLTRYADIRDALLDAKRFTNQPGSTSDATGAAVRPDEDDEKARELIEAMEADEKVRTLFEEKGWVTGPTVNGLDAPEHMERRRLFEHAFRPAAIAQYDPYIDALAHRLIDDFIDDGECDFVSRYAVPLPLYVIGKVIGAPEEDMPQIQVWTDAWIERMGLMQTTDEKLWSAGKEIEAQHYNQAHFDRVREHPDNSLLSAFVNTPIPEWGRPLDDHELHSEIMTNFWVGGSETVRNAISAGLMLLIENPHVWRALSEDVEGVMPAFLEEVLRLESPSQGLLRAAAVDIELHGVTIPAGSVINVRFGAGNRDPRRFECPAEMRLDRDKARSHLAFGVGAHHCLGAPLARREMHFAFKALVERFDEFWFLDDKPEFTYQQNYFLRALQELRVGFKAKSSSRDAVEVS
jgi:cytochrome P450